jgi:hypothetical protein
MANMAPFFLVTGIVGWVGVGGIGIEVGRIAVD